MSACAVLVTHRVLLCAVLFVLLQEHWEVFVGLFDETMNQLEKDIPLETREVGSSSSSRM